jgi:hypothetical protein
MESPVLSFGFKDKLWRVAAAGTTHSADPYGGATVQRYRELSSSLAEKYGPGRETDVRDTEMWKSPSEYIMSLKQGRASRYTTFNSPSVTVELSIRAAETDGSYYLLIYRHRAGEKEFDVDKRANERGLL